MVLNIEASPNKTALVQKVLNIELPKKAEFQELRKAIEAAL